MHAKIQKGRREFNAQCLKTDSNLDLIPPNELLSCLSQQLMNEKLCFDDLFSSRYKLNFLHRTAQA